MAWIEEKGNGFRVVWRKDGKKQSRHFRDRGEAEWFANTLLSRPLTAAEAIERLSGRKQKSPLTPKLSAYATDVIESDPNIGVGSRDAYLSTIRNHIEDSVIDVAIGSIEPNMLRKFWTNLRPMKDYAAAGNGMKASVHRLLTKVFNQAVRDGIIPTSPMLRANIRRPSKKRATEVDPLTIDEIEELAAACLNERDRLLILVGGYCGLRGGEVGGLRVKDVDPKSCRFHIRQAVKREDGKLILGLPKGNRTRTITVPCSLAKEIVKFARKNAAKDGRIFHTPVDGMIGATKTNKVSQAAAARIGMQAVNFHTLRHSCASLLIEDGANVKDIQEYLGHSSPSITLDVYSHLFRGSDQKLADSMEARRQDWQAKIKKTNLA